MSKVIKIQDKESIAVIESINTFNEGNDLKQYTQLHLLQKIVEELKQTNKLLSKIYQ